MASYPSHLVRSTVLADGTPVTIRPIRPEDAALSQQFVRNLSDESRYFRFMDSLRELTPDMVTHLTRVDHNSHLALIAVSGPDGTETEIGVARYFATADRQLCEFAVVVADEWQRKGLGAQLMQALIAAARASGVRTMYGDVLCTNSKMLRFVTHLGFTAKPHDTDPRLLRVELPLRSPPR